MATMSRTQGCISLSSAEAECYGMVSALAETKQIQEILSEYHEDTHIILETDSYQQLKQNQSVLDLEK